jgi:predicted flap endonuclease-1-like 5' DNA nuclease
MLMEGDEVGLTALKHRLVPERDHATAGGTPAEGIAADDLEPETEGEYQRSDDEAAAEAGPSGTGIVSTPEEPAEDPAEEDPDDDLERIEGVGPRIAAALHAADLNSYRHIAAAEPATLQAALEAAGLRFAPSLPTWPRQAILLADGDTEGHARLTASLVSGSDADRKS